MMCDVCGRELCRVLDRPADYSEQERRKCAALGYERQKARADALEAEVARLNGIAEAQDRLRQNAEEARDEALRRLINSEVEASGLRVRVDGVDAQIRNVQAGWRAADDRAEKAEREHDLAGRALTLACQTGRGDTIKLIAAEARVAELEGLLREARAHWLVPRPQMLARIDTALAAKPRDAPPSANVAQDLDGLAAVLVTGERKPVLDPDAPPSKPLDVMLHCPSCGLLHVDAPEPERGWANPPHKSHLCHGCGTIWRPSDEPTNGIAAPKTRGSADTWPNPLPASGTTSTEEVISTERSILPEGARGRPASEDAPSATPGAVSSPSAAPASEVRQHAEKQVDPPAALPLAGPTSGDGSGRVALPTPEKILADKQAAEARAAELEGLLREARKFVLNEIYRGRPDRETLRAFVNSIDAALATQPPDAPLSAPLAHKPSARGEAG